MNNTDSVRHVNEIGCVVNEVKAASLTHYLCLSFSMHELCIYLDIYLMRRETEMEANMCAYKRETRDETRYEN